MKRIKHVLVLIVALIIAGVFVGCPPEENGGEPEVKKHTLTVPDVTVKQYRNTPIVPLLKDPDGNTLTSGTTYAYALVESPVPGLTFTGNNAVAAGTTAAGEYEVKATARRSGEDVAEAVFNVTVELADYAIIIPASNIRMSHFDEDRLITVTLQAPNGSTSGITTEFVCSDHPSGCPINFSGNTIQKLDASVTIGVHNYVAKAMENTAQRAQTDFMITVFVEYDVETEHEEYHVSPGDEITINYTLTASDGSSAPTNIIVGINCEADYGNCPLHTGEWGDLWIDIPESADARSHDFKMTAEWDETSDTPWERIAENFFKVIVE